MLRPSAWMALATAALLTLLTGSGASSQSYAAAGDTGDSGGPNPPTAFSCQPFFYQFSDGYLYRFNAVTGSYDDTDLDDTDGDDGNDWMNSVPRLPGANGVGYNPADDYIYAIDNSRELYRVGVDNWVSLGKPTGDTTIQRTAGDFIDDNILLTASGNNFSKITISGDSATVESYTTSGDSWSPADFTVDANGTYAYGMASTTLYRLTISSGLVETHTVSMSGNNGGTGWGSAYSTQGGDLFFYQNTNNANNGQIWKIASSDVDTFSDGGTGLSATRILSGQSLSTPNDGASCPTANSPFDAPVVVGDAYAYTTGSTFSANAEELGLIAGDSASSAGAVIYKVGLSSDLSSDSQDRLPLDTALTSDSVAAATNTGSDNQVSNGTQTLTITDWDTGEFEVTGLSGTFTFYYQVVEEQKVSGNSTRRTSNIGTVTIDSLSINKNGSGDAGTVLPSATQFTSYSGHSFVANTDPDETSDDYFWKAAFIEDGSGDSLPSSPPRSTSLPAGLSLDSDTGALSGVPIGSELSANTSYTIKVFAALDNQFKTYAEQEFSLTIQEPSRFTVSYDANEPSGAASGRTTGSAPSGTTAARFTVSGSGSLSNPCLTFDGWNTQSDGNGTDLSETDVVTLTDATLPDSDTSTVLPAANTSLYAQWVDSRVGVTYSSTSEDSGSVPTDSGSYCEGDSVTVAGNTGTLVRDGFRFLGWNTDSGSSSADFPAGNPGTFSATRSAVTLHAIWSEEFSISFDGNSAASGSAPVDNSGYIAGQTVTLPANTGNLTNPGFRLSGWNTAADGSGTTYPATGSGTLSMPTSDLTLYAVWSVPESQQPESRRSPRTTREETPPAPLVAPATPRPRLAAEPEADGLERPVRPSPVPNRSPEPPTTADPTPVPAPTIDLGAGTVQADASQVVGYSQSAAMRTPVQLAQERLGGFLPTAPITIEVRGAKTASRFVTDDEILNQPPLLLEQVALAAQAQSSGERLFTIQNLTLQPERTRDIGSLPETDRDIEALFSDSGLPTPQYLTQELSEQLAAEEWLSVSAQIRDYKPGSAVYLVVNSEPLIVGHALVNENGQAVLEGDIPVSWFGIGEHRIRAVGVRVFEDISVDQRGELVIPDPVITDIQQFDLGTQATVLASGPNPEGSQHLAVRVIPLEPVAPWWTLWIIFGAFVLMLIARLRGVLATRTQALVGGFAVLMSAVPGVVLGWTSTVTIVAVWAVALGLLGAIVIAAIPRVRADSRRS